MTFEEGLKDFLSGSEKNKWIGFKDGEVYIRKSKRLAYLRKTNPRDFFTCLDLANIKIDWRKQNSGIFTRDVLTVAQNLCPFEAVMIESVLTERFAEYFYKKVLEDKENAKGWMRFGEDNCNSPSFFWFK